MKSKAWNLLISIAAISMLITACGTPATSAPTAAATAIVPVTGGSATPASGTGSSASGAPIKIGISLSLSGDFSADGQGFKQGYQLWADTVNKNGGLLGRKVELDILSDASSPDQVQTNYQKLITVDKVDLVFGPYSSLLTKPASVVANRYGYAMVEGAGGAPSVFDRGLKNVFDVSVPVIRNLDNFGAFLLALPADQRPTSVAYATEDDPFAQPEVDRLKGQMEAAQSLGMTRNLALRRIIIPQATRIVIPPVTNDFIALFKDTAVCSTIMIVELTGLYYQYKIYPSLVLELAFAVAVLYLLMSYPMAVLARHLERRTSLTREDRR